MDELDLTSAASKATYEQIQEWVRKKYGFHVTHLPHRDRMQLVPPKESLYFDDDAFDLSDALCGKAPEVPETGDGVIIDHVMTSERIFEKDRLMIHRARMEDAEVLADLAVQMWTDHDPEDLTEEFRRLAANDDAVCFIRYADDKPVAFARFVLAR